MNDMTEKEKEAANLRLLLGGVNKAEFVRTHKVPGGASMVSQNESGHRPISMEGAIAYARGLGVPLEKISERIATQVADAARLIGKATVIPATTDGVLEGYVRLEHLSPRPSMGPGNAVGGAVFIVRHLDVLESWARQKVGSADSDRIKILSGCGQSMSPTIQDNDLVFVDIFERTIDIPGIYVIDVHGRFLLKRALILSDGTLVLTSDNREEFPDEERIDLRRYADTVNVAGRVKAWWTLKHG